MPGCSIELSFNVFSYGYSQSWRERWAFLLGLSTLRWCTCYHVSRIFLPSSTCLRKLPFQRCLFLTSLMLFYIGLIHIRPHSLTIRQRGHLFFQLFIPINFHPVAAFIFWRAFGAKPKLNGKLLIFEVLGRLLTYDTLLVFNKCIDFYYDRTLVRQPALL